MLKKDADYGDILKSASFLAHTNLLLFSCRYYSENKY